MSYRLLIAVEVLDFVRSLSRANQQQLWKRFREIGESPHRFADYTEPDRTQRLLDVHLHAGFAIFYWEDSVDRHVKILEIVRADR